jgi:hypothetical protein
MSQVITFQAYTPVRRYDGQPWTSVRIEEADAADGTWEVIDTIAIDPVDPDPTDPAARNFTTELASDTPLLWYRLTFVDATTDTEQPTEPVQNGGRIPVYGTMAELQRRLKIRDATDAQEDEMVRVLTEASGEVNSEIDLGADVELDDWMVALATGVTYDRAVELWAMSPFGIIGLDQELVTHTARNSWERYAHRLAPLKNQWGLA